MQSVTLLAREVRNSMVGNCELQLRWEVKAGEGLELGSVGQTLI